jgi:hypothetical protein
MSSRPGSLFPGHVLFSVQRLEWLLIAALSIGPTSSVSLACPFCSAPALTLSERRAESEAMVVARYLGELVEPSLQDGVASSRMQRFGRTAVDPQGTACPREILVSMQKVTDPAPCYLLFGSRMPGWHWSDPLPATTAVVTYVRDAPPLISGNEEQVQLARLRYFLRHLEDRDVIVAEDAYGEFANSDYKVIVKLRGEFPRELLATWVISPNTPASRRGLYGLLLGLCGDDDDARLMEQLITGNLGEEIRPGIDGVMGGYLLLTGEAGLEFLERTKIRPRDVPFTELYAACQALRFAWQYAETTISRVAVRQTMRAALHREDVADLIIADLARWKDWELQPRLMELYGQPGYDSTTMRRAIVRFMAVSAREKPTGNPETDQFIAVGARCLEELRRREPAVVKDALRFLVPVAAEKLR